MSKKYKSIVWLFVFGFFVAEVLLVLVGNMNFNSKRNHILEDRTTQLHTSYESIFNTYGLVSNLVYEQIVNTPQITELYSRAYKNSEKRKAEIRDSLFQILNPTYLELSSKSIKQLHFHLPDNESFLRFHSPKKFGDDITKVRESVRIANAEKRFVQGFEEGKIYNGFRFVYPLSYKDEHIGTVESSISFGALNTMLRKQARNTYSFILRKSVVDEKVFESEKSNYLISAISDDWVEEKRFLHYDFSGENLSEETLKKIDKVIKEKYQNKLDEKLPFSVFVDLNKNRYTVSFIPILNIKKEHVAFLMSYVIDTYSESYRRSFIVLIGAGSFLILLIMLLFYVIYIKNNTIEDQHSELVKSETRYKHIYNTIDIGIISNSLNGDILMANPKIIEMLGCKSLADLKTYNIKDFYIDPSAREKLIASLQEKETNLVTHDLLWKRKDDKPITVKFGGKIHTDINGEQFIESVVQDVTEMRTLEDSLKLSETGLRESNAAKDRFFSIIAHDLRGPFNSLLGLTEIIALQPETLDEKRMMRFIHLIHKSVKNLSSLIENLLEWSRSQRGAISYTPKEIKLEPLVQETVALLSDVGFAKNIVLMVNIDKDIHVMVDVNMVKTIIRNLMSNAIKYTHKEGLVKIYSRNILSEENKKLIEIIVEDNGVGIAEKDLSKLFKIDSGFTNPGTENEHGTGLGLVLVKEFIEKHQGTIAIESEEGIGTKVIFTIPRV
jgi:PAS domain S-box-containing protein